MTPPEGTNWPALLDALDAEHDIAIAEDAGHTSPPVPIEAFSDSIDTVLAAIEAATARRDAANTAAEIADDARDMPALNRAQHDLDRAEHDLALLQNRKWDLDEAAGFAEARERRRDYYASR